MQKADNNNTKVDAKSKFNNVISAVNSIAKEHRIAILLIAIFFMIQLSIIIWTFHPTSWDESVYLGMGKYIFSGGFSGLWESIRPLGLPIMTGLSWIIGSQNNQIAISQIIILLFSVGLLIVEYLLALRLAKDKSDKRIAILSLVILICSPIFLSSSRSIFTEIPSAFFVLLALYLALNEKYFFAGISSAIAVMFRFPQAIIIFSIIIITLIYTLTERMQDKKNRKKNIHHQGYKLRNNIKFINNIRFNNNIRFFIKNMLIYALGILVIIVPFFIINYSLYQPRTDNAFQAIILPLVSAMPHQNNSFFSQAGPGSSFILSILNNASYYIVISTKYPVLLLFIVGIVLYIIYCIRKYNIRKFEYSSRKYTIRKRHLDKFAEMTLSGIIISLVLFFIYLSYITNKQERFIIMMIAFMAIVASWVFFEIIDALDFKIMIQKIATTLIILLMVFSFANGIVLGVHDVRWYKTEPIIVTDAYRYIDRNNISGPIITTTPIISAYSDRLFIPAYDTISQNNDNNNNNNNNTNNIFVNPWDENESIGKGYPVFYSPESFPCRDDDEHCIAIRNGQKDILTENLTQVYNGYYEDVHFMVYVKK